jgi:hypothetical protein
MWKNYERMTYKYERIMKGKTHEHHEWRGDNSVLLLCLTFVLFISPSSPPSPSSSSSWSCGCVVVAVVQQAVVRRSTPDSGQHPNSSGTR